MNANAAPRSPALVPVLVATDLSELSFKALTVGAELAQRFSGTLCVAHVVIPPFADAPLAYSAAMTSTFEHALNEQERMAREVIAEHVAGLPVPATIAILRSYPVADALLEHGRSLGARLLVLATHGHTGFRRWMLGSTAERLVRISPIPVLTVHAGEP